MKDQEKTSPEGESNQIERRDKKKTDCPTFKHKPSTVMSSVVRMTQASSRVWGDSCLERES